VILDSGYGGSGTVSLTLRLGVVSISYVFTEKRIEPPFQPLTTNDRSRRIPKPRCCLTHVRPEKCGPRAVWKVS